MAQLITPSQRMDSWLSKSKEEKAMKKYFLTLLPLLALVGCASEPAVTHQQKESPFVVTYENGIPKVGFKGSEGSDHVTYLMMSPFGYLSVDGAPVKGQVAELFYENTIIWDGEVGSPLPDASIVKTTVSGASFRGWAYYGEDYTSGNPTYYTEVPSTKGLALKAIFDGTDAGGNQGGGGGSGGGGGGGTSAKGFTIKYLNSGTIPASDYKGTNFEGYEEYLVSGASFAVGDTFALYDHSSGGTWTVDINPYSFDPAPTEKTADPARVASYVTKGATYYTVNQAFTADLYIQIMYQQDRLYIELV